MPLQSNAASKFKVFGIVVGVLVGMLLVLWLVTRGLNATIDAQKNEITDLTDRLATCNAAKIGLEGAIESQNVAVEKSRDIAERMRAQREDAKAEAEQARSSANSAIAAMRRENARAQSCEQARQKLITEAIGYEF